MTSQSYAAFRVANIRNVVTDLGTDAVQAIEAEKFAALGGSMDVMLIDAAAVKNIAPLMPRGSYAAGHLQGVADRRGLSGDGL